MKIKLPSTGQEIYIGCKHEWVRYGGRANAITQVWIEDVETHYCLATAFATCSLKDNFCRRTGRKIAAERLIKAVWAKNVSSKEDRRAVFQALCPEFFKKKEKANRG